MNEEDFKDQHAQLYKVDTGHGVCPNCGSANIQPGKLRPLSWGLAAFGVLFLVFGIYVLLKATFRRDSVVVLLGLAVVIFYAASKGKGPNKCLYCGHIY